MYAYDVVKHLAYEYVATDSLAPWEPSQRVTYAGGILSVGGVEVPIGDNSAGNSSQSAYVYSYLTAEENGGLDPNNNNGYQFSWGNGALSADAAFGAYIHEDVTVVALALNAEKNMTNVDVVLTVNGINSDLHAEGNQAKIIVGEGEVPVLAGANIAPRTLNGAGGSDIVVTMVLRQEIVLSGGGGSGGDPYNDGELRDSISALRSAINSIDVSYDDGAMRDSIDSHRRALDSLATLAAETEGADYDRIYASVDSLGDLITPHPQQYWTLDEGDVYTENDVFVDGSMILLGNIRASTGDINFLQDAFGVKSSLQAFGATGNYNWGGFAGSLSPRGYLTANKFFWSAGEGTLESLEDGEGVIAMGDNAGASLIQAKSAVLLGEQALSLNAGATVGDYSIAIGHRALSGATMGHGQDQIAIGPLAGQYNNYSQSILLGREAQAEEDGHARIGRPDWIQKFSVGRVDWDTGTAPADGQSFVYDASQGRMVLGTFSGGGGYNDGALRDSLAAHVAWLIDLESQIGNRPTIAEATADIAAAEQRAKDYADANDDVGTDNQNASEVPSGSSDVQTRLDSAAAAIDYLSSPFRAPLFIDWAFEPLTVADAATNFSSAENGSRLLAKVNGCRVAEYMKVKGVWQFVQPIAPAFFQTYAEAVTTAGSEPGSHDFTFTVRHAANYEPIYGIVSQSEADYSIAITSNHKKSSGLDDYYETILLATYTPPAGGQASLPPDAITITLRADFCTGEYSSLTLNADTRPTQTGDFTYSITTTYPQ
jgi:hypothetical protein